MKAVLDAFFTSGFVGQAIVLLLLVASVLAWARMLWKRRVLASVDHWDRALFRACDPNAAPHPAYPYVKASEGRALRDGVPAVAIYRATMKELMAALARAGVDGGTILSWRPGYTGPALPESAMASVRAAAEGELSVQLMRLEEGMSFLATCVSAAPSLGLFGTVWGIMMAFMSMVSGGSAILITAVAPGIAAALLTTVVGLVVSIPSSIGYNALFDRVHANTVALENFTDKLLADILRVHGATAFAQPVQAAPVVLQAAAPYPQPAPYPQAAPMPAPGPGAYGAPAPASQAYVPPAPDSRF